MKTTNATNPIDAWEEKHGLDLTHGAMEDLYAAILKCVPEKPNEADKTPKPELERVTESFAEGVTISTTRETGRTYTEQDEEDFAFEAAQPYLNIVRANLAALFDIGGEDGR